MSSGIRTSDEWMNQAVSTIPDDDKEAGNMLVGEILRKASAYEGSVPCYEYKQLLDLAQRVRVFSDRWHQKERQDFEAKNERKYKILLGAARKSPFFDALPRQDRAVINKTYRVFAKMKWYEKFGDFCKEIWRDLTRAKKIELGDDIVLANINVNRLFMEKKSEEGPVPYLETCYQFVTENEGKDNSPRQVTQEGKVFEWDKLQPSTKEYLEKYRTLLKNRLEQLNDKGKIT